MTNIDSASCAGRKLTSTSPIVLLVICGTVQGQWAATDIHPSGVTHSKVLGGQFDIEVGYTLTSGAFHAAAWGSSAATWVDIHPSGNSDSIAYCLSPDGACIGGQVSVPPHGYAHAAIWDTSTLDWTDLHNYGLSSTVLGCRNGEQGGFSGGFHGGTWSGSSSSWNDLNPSSSAQSKIFAVTSGSQVGSFQANLTAPWKAAIWSGTSSSHVSINPTSASESEALGANSVYQCGYVTISGNKHASLWSGTSSSWVDIHPAGASASKAHALYGGQQAGFATMRGSDHAGIWNGTASTWVDLHSYLGSNYSQSAALAVWGYGPYLYVGGSAVDSNDSNRTHAIIWVKCRIDMNDDGFVNGDDWDAFAEAFDNSEPIADFNNDGFVNGNDYDDFDSAFEAGC